MPHIADSAPFVDMSGVAEALDDGLGRIAGLFNTYVGLVARGEVGLELFTGKNAYPVRVELTGGEATEALHCIGATLDHLEPIARTSERIATAFERIATALERK
jgi:hypothetical protein